MWRNNTPYLQWQGLEHPPKASRMSKVIYDLTQQVSIEVAHTSKRAPTSGGIFHMTINYTSNYYHSSMSYSLSRNIEDNSNSFTNHMLCRFAGKIPSPQMTSSFASLPTAP
jgi:hypothetical protein